MQHIAARILLFAFLFGSALSSLHAQSAAVNWKKSYPWVDSVMATLTLDEKIAQLMTVAVWTQRDTGYMREIEKLVTEQKIGGIMFMKGTPYREAVLTNQFQAKSKIPLLVSMDGEYGLSMRLDSTPVLPRQMVLGGANNPELTRLVGAEIAKEFKRIGIHLNYAPDVDINNNPANPVINDRSFGENKYIVAKHGAALARGMQEQQVMACAKHFPGHGDTEADSHFALPVINASAKRLDSLELYPFKELIKSGVGAVMVAHLFVPAIDTNANRATSISTLAVHDLLKTELGFEGLVITDGLNMAGVANYAAVGEVSAKALAAGNELLLFVENVPQSIFWIKEYIARGVISEDDVNKACRKILITKNWCGLNQYKPVELDHLTDDLNCCSSELLTHKVIKQGIVVAKNTDHLIPLEKPQQYKIASLAVGNNQFTRFQQTLNNYLHADYFAIDKNETQLAFDSMFTLMQRYNLVIISLHNTSRFVSKKLGLTQPEVDFVNRLLADRKCILVNHGNPYILKNFTTARNVILGYEDLPDYNFLAAQALMGAYVTGGKMPVSVTPAFALGSGIETEKQNRFEYVMPEEAGVDPYALRELDSIVQEGLNQKAYPGCQVLVAKAGKVFYQRSFGKLSYDTAAAAVQDYHLYDLASLTKMLGTTLAMMKLYEDGLIGLNDKLGLYLPFLRGTNKEKLTIKDIMLHQAGLVPFIPFYKNTVKGGMPDTLLYHRTPNGNYTVQVADSLYIHKNYEDTLWTLIASSELKNKGEYIYSDLGFMMLKRLVETVSNQPFERYLADNFYKPLNLANMVYNPLDKGILKSNIAPTELDVAFRQQVVHGHVHDPGAAMLGGVSGHAGLFANANDVAVIMQMLLNGGTYGNARVLKTSTVELFTRRQTKKSRRGLGFDKPEADPAKPSPTGKSCSPLTFGHTGFTGTCAWADPKSELVFVFLSNRVHPSAEANKLAQLNIRTRMQDLLYDVIKRR